MRRPHGEGPRSREEDTEVNQPTDPAIAAMLDDLQATRAIQMLSRIDSAEVHSGGQ